MDSNEDLHQVVKLLIVSFFITPVATVEESELVLEFLLYLDRVSLVFILLFAVNSDEIRQFGSSLALADLNDDPHDDILEGVLSDSLSVTDAFVLGKAHDIVTGVLPLLLEDLVLVDEQVTTEWLVLVLLDQLLHL